MSKLTFGIFAILLLFVLWINGPDRKYAFDYPVEEPIHYHAGILVYKDGILGDFTDTKYMKVNPCLIDDEHIQELSTEEEQLEKAHFHDNIADVVHVHRENATWRDLFINADIDVSENAYAYQRGLKIDNILDSTIEPDDSIIIIDGTAPRNLNSIINNPVLLERIKEVESRSENCAK